MPFRLQYPEKTDDLLQVVRRKLDGLLFKFHERYYLKEGFAPRQGYPFGKGISVGKNPTDELAQVKQVAFYIRQTT